MIETLRLSERGKDQLVKLRRSTGVKHWNALCRWALCTSLADERPVGDARIVADSNVELSWKVLTGEWSDVYLALLQQRCEVDACGNDAASLNMLLRRHVHRGIAILTGSEEPCSLLDLCRKAVKPN